MGINHHLSAFYYLPEDGRPDGTQTLIPIEIRIKYFFRVYYQQSVLNEPSLL